MTTGQKCALYLRISLDATGDELGVTRQQEDGRKLIAARGWDLYEVYVDNDTSAAGKVERPAFERMLADYQADRFAVIVSRDMDRLTRNRRDRVRILELGEARGLLLSFTRGSDLDLSTPSGRMLADILATMARHEIEQMGDRRRRANVQKAEMGLPTGGRRPFGYCQHTRDQAGTETGRTCGDPACPGSMRSLVPVEAEALRRAAELVVSGPGLWAAVGHLRESGLTTTSGGEWHHTELRRLLLNPRYAGRRMHRGVDVGPAQWPAIFDEDTFTALRTVLTAPGRARRGAPVRYLLSSLARCGTDGCGRVIHGSPTSGGPIYTCETRRHVAVKAEPVDAYVIEAVAARLARPDGLALFARDTAQGDGLGELRARESAMEARLAILAEAFAVGDIDREQLAAGTARVRSELEQIRSRMAEAVAVPMFRDLLDADDVGALVRRWAVEDRGRFRAVVQALAEVSLRSPGRGARRFRPESVRLAWRG